ncbi:MAG: 5-(carboxyamino)imidazole ribonucleotide synthase [Hyphomonadaceae bacterium]|nr:5-(carboxyamino)imidazole ribonucleotide synthase [Hyphomonadaceae bacterium]
MTGQGTGLKPGEALGILGGGQLGRMLAIAAAQIGLDVHVYTDEADSPASRVAAKTIVGAYDDEAKLAAFAREARIVTSEFENVPAATADALVAAGAIVRPDPRALAVAQDRFDEKTFLNSMDVPTVPFAAVNSLAELEAALSRIGTPAILKTRRLGYDGLGQARLQSGADAAAAWEKMSGAPAILEGFASFEREVSIIAARGADGSFARYDLCENDHAGGILSSTRLPARASPAVSAAAEKAVRRVMEHFDYVGVLTIEFFLMADGALIANEMAPRVHNSGHWTIEGALTSQFEQHVRAVVGWRLGPAARIADCEMTNLIGEDASRWAEIASDPSAHLHLYGKRSTRAGRKMGHVTRLKFPPT